MYSPVPGRFLERDPVGYVDGLNLYAYVQNNPIKYLDPEGLMVRWASDKIETGITEASSYLETGLNIFSDYMTEHSEGIEQGVQSVVEKSGIENLRATLNTMAFTYGVSESILWGGATLLASSPIIQASATAGVGVGGFSFGSEWIMSQDLGKATQSGIVDATTTFVSIASTLSGVGKLVPIVSTFGTNAAMQKIVKNEIDPWSLGLSAAPPSLGGAFLSTKNISGKSLGLVTTSIYGPITIGLNAISNK